MEYCGKDFNSCVEKLVFEAFYEERFYIPEETLIYVADFIQNKLKEKVGDIMLNGYDDKYGQLRDMLSNYTWKE